MWVLTPYLYFEDEGITFQKNVNKLNVFLKFMGNSLKSRKRLMQIPDAFITSFKLHTHYNFRPGAAQRIDNWVKFAIQSKVKELDIYGKHYCFPRSILSASSLTLLRLTCVRLEAPSISAFPYLKVLRLSNVKFDELSLQNIILGCPIIEDLQLYGFTLGDIDLSISGTLRSLSLRHVTFANQWLEGLIPGIPFLETLILYSHWLENISIKSHSLKSLFFYVSRSNEVMFRTPNLICLDFACFSNSMISIEAPNLLKTNLALGNNSMKKPDYYELIRLLSNLNCLKKLCCLFSRNRYL